jgi:hypothetical protein
MNQASVANTTESLLFSSWEDEFLHWFAGLNVAMREHKLQLGGLSYHHFSALFDITDGRKTSSFGSHPTRQIAALKCAAEAIERQTMVDFFMQNKNQLPKAFCNSNGWAVHSSAAAAKESSMREAIERHLLMKSFFYFGWEGFHPFQIIKSGDLNLTLLVSRFTTENHIAGLVIAKSPLYPGVSFGYTAGLKQNLGDATFWQSAIFEAIDRILILKGDKTPKTDNSWIKSTIADYLETPFIEPKFASPSFDLIETDIGDIESEVIDLSLEKSLKFPLYAAFTYGGNLIPLFSKACLDSNDADYLEKILQKNSLSLTQIPDRHPIL